MPRKCTFQAEHDLEDCSQGKIIIDDLLMCEDSIECMLCFSCCDEIRMMYTTPVMPDLRKKRESRDCEFLTNHKKDLRGSEI